ncbi:transposable element Tcb2 transposase [Trichonephila clavipes]|nr:transposable element Tcb2 transposase [Trichonephila clavipes]
MHVKSIETQSFLRHGVIVWRKGAKSGVTLVTTPMFKITKFVAFIPRVALQAFGENVSYVSGKLIPFSTGESRSRRENLSPLKSDCVRPLQREKRLDSWSLPIWSIHVQSSSHYVSDFPQEHLVFQDDNGPVPTSRCDKTWLHEHDEEVEHVTWCPQSPDLNIIECLWGLLENKIFLVCAWFPLLLSLSEFETALNEEWLRVSMNFVQDIYLSFLHRVQAVIQIKGCPIPY